MNHLYQFLVLSIALTNVWASTIIKTSACNGQNGTCSPSWCSRVSNTACVDSTADLTNFQGPMSTLGCKVCTQSTQSKCSSSYLNSVLKTGGGLLAVYCNDDYLVVYSSGEAVHKDGLKYIPRPPGEGGVPYSAACVTRSYHTAAAFYKVPLNPVMLSTADASNNLYLFDGQTDPGNIVDMGLPESGPASVSVSGQSIFPLYNNIGAIAHADCEMDLCSAHAGQGFDYHYHGDPFHPVAGTCMYSLDDYGEDSDHPPLIGWGLDGYEIYGRHISVSNLGYSYDLDTCGGHEHNDIDGVTAMTYHYHSQVLNETSSAGKAYTTYIAGVNNCWRGNISEVKFFGNSVAFESRPDFELLKPCCDSPEYYTASGVSLTTTTVSTSPTKRPTKSPSKAPTREPTVLASNGVPSRAPSAIPTAGPSFAPSLQTAPIISFSTSTTLSGMSNSLLSAADEAAVVNATATALGVSIDCVTYSGTTVVSSSRRQLKGNSVLSGSYTLTASTSVSVPLISYSTTDATAAYQLLTDAFDSAIASGDFIRYLTAASDGGLFDTSPSIAVDSHSVDNEVVEDPPSFQPTKDPSGGSSAVLQGTILYIVIAIGGAVFLAILLYCITLSRGSNVKSTTASGYRRPADPSAQDIELPPTTVDQANNQTIKI